MWQSTVLVPVGLARVILRRLITNDKLQPNKAALSFCPPPPPFSLRQQFQSKINVANTNKKKIAA